MKNNIAKIIVAGSRNFNNYNLLETKLDKILNNLSEINDIEIVSGGAIGADTLAEKYAKNNNYKLSIFPANWIQYGKKAGYLRNKQMADYVGKDGYLVAFWDGRSRGTKMMIDIAKDMNIKTRVVKYEWWE